MGRCVDTAGAVVTALVAVVTLEIGAVESVVSTDPEEIAALDVSSPWVVDVVASSNARCGVADVGSVSRKRAPASNTNRTARRPTTGSATRRPPLDSHGSSQGEAI